MSTRSYPLTSSFRPTYNMAANLVKSFEPELARNLLNLSFAQFRSDAEIVHLEARLSRMRAEQEGLMDEAHCDLGDVSGYFELTRRVEKAKTNAETIPAERHVFYYFARLRPGDVLCVPADDSSGVPTRVVVVATSRKKGGRVSAWVVTSEGTKVPMRVGEVDFLPKPVARIDVGVDYNPREHAYLSAMAAALRELPIANCSFSEPRFSRSAQGRATAEPSRQDIIELRDELRQCPDFNRHVSALKKLARLSEASSKIKASVKSHSESLARQFDRVLEVLDDLGFVKEWELTEQGERLAGLFHESDLLIAISLDSAIFDGLEPADLAALLSVFVYESRVSAPGSDRFPNRELERRFSQVNKLRIDLVKTEGRLRIPATKPVESGFMVYASAWAKGRELESVIGDKGIPGGDFVRFVKQIMDLARQLSNVVSDPVLAQNFAATNRLLCRGVVEASIRVER